MNTFFTGITGLLYGTGLYDPAAYCRTALACRCRSYILKGYGKDFTLYVHIK